MSLSTPFGPSRYFKITPEETLKSGDISPAVEIPFHYGSGWLMALHHSIEDHTNVILDYFKMSKIAIEIHISGEPYTEGARGGGEFIILSDFHGDHFDYHWMMRRVCSDDSLVIRWKNIAEYSIAHDLEILPSITFRYMLDADIKGIDLSKMCDIAGIPWP